MGFQENVIKVGVLAGSEDTMRHWVQQQVRQPLVQYTYLRSEQSMRGIDFDLYLVLDCFYSPRNKRGQSESQMMVDIAQYFTQRKAEAAGLTAPAFVPVDDKEGG